MRLIAIILSSLALTACGEGFSGTYADSAGIQKYKFKSNGEVTISQMGVDQTVKFERDEICAKLVS